MTDSAKSLDHSHSPPSALGWFPLSVSIEVNRALPAQGVKWLFTRMRTRELIDGRLEVSGEVWDEEGELVALSQQQVWIIVEAPKGAQVCHETRRGEGE